MTQLEVFIAFTQGLPARKNNLASTGKQLLWHSNAIAVRHDTGAYTFDFCGRTTPPVRNMLNRLRAIIGGPQVKKMKYSHPPANREAWEFWTNTKEVTS